MIKRKEMLVTTQNAVVVLVIETKEEVSSRIGRNFPLFLHLVLRYMSLYKYILNARPFISAFSLFFSSLLYDDNKNSPVLLSRLSLSLSILCGCHRLLYLIITRLACSTPTFFYNSLLSNKSIILKSKLCLFQFHFKIISELF
jgi:hypothetical protein